MARGRRDLQSRIRVRRNLLLGVLTAGSAAAFSLVPPVGGKPVGGYIASILLIAASAQVAIPLPFSLVPITGQTFGDNVQAWRDWWEKERVKYEE